MNTLMICGVILLIILIVLNKIYIKESRRINEEKLKELQVSLWGYSGEPTEEKKEELYQKYLDVVNNEKTFGGINI